LTGFFTYILNITDSLVGESLITYKEKNMTDRAKFEQMLEYLINEDKTKAEELFHELVVAKSREIYENLLDDDIQVDEASDEEDEDEDVEENFDMGVQEIGGDPADDMMGDMEADDEEGDEDSMDGEEGGEEPATKDDVMDIKDALEDLKAEFEALLAGEKDEEGADDMDMGDEEDEEEMKDDVQFEASEDEDEEDMEEGMVREYVEKVAPAKMGDNGANTKSTVAGKNDMGGTTANMVKGGESNKGGTQGGLANPSTKDIASGNVNVPGGKAGVKHLKGVGKPAGGDDGQNKKSTLGA
jgi:hypothetical protein